MTCWLCHGGAPGRRVVLGPAGRRVRLWPPARDRRRARRRERRRGRVPARARLSVRAHGARAPAAGRARAAGSDGRVRPRRDRARLSLGALRRDRARPPGDARHRQPDQRSRHHGGAGAGARELVGLRGRGSALAGAAGRARRTPGTRRRSARFGLPDGDRRRRPARAAVRPAQPRHARPAARFVPGAALVRRDLRPRHAVGDGDRGDPAMYAAASVRGRWRGESALWNARGDASEGGAADASRAAARSSRSGSWERSPTARSSSARPAPTRQRRSTGRCWRRSIRRSRSTRSCPCAAPTATRRRRWRTCGRSPKTRRRSGDARTATSTPRTRRGMARREDPSPRRGARGKLITMPPSLLGSARNRRRRSRSARGATRSIATSDRWCYSSSRLFPFDADGDGDAQGHPAADRRAGGIGTEPLLAFDVPSHAVAVLDRPRRSSPIRRAPAPSATPASAPPGCGPRRSSR